jgi:non-heme chloroperoxidase
MAQCRPPSAARLRSLLGVDEPGSATDDDSAAPGVGPSARRTSPERDDMTLITTQDRAKIFYRDIGSGQPIVFSHGWPLTCDDWEAQLMFFAERGYRVIAHDRRGHGRSTQTFGGHDMDTYADDLFALVETLDLRDAVHIGHSTGGGEVARYLSRHPSERTAAAVLISAVVPYLLQTPDNPEGTPMAAFDGFRAQILADRAQLYREIPEPFYGFNRPGAKVSQGLKDRWWLQGMMGSLKAHHDCIKAFSETDFREEMKSIQIPVLILHGEDDQIVPYKATALNAATLLPNATLKTYPGFPHGMPSTHHPQINADILAFLQQLPARAPSGTMAHA